MPGSEGTAIFFSPHPDDEILSSGAFLLHLRKSGWEIIIVYLTSGSDISAQEERDREAEDVCRELGAAPIFLHATRTSDPTHLVDRIITILHQHQPDIVIFPSPKDPHPTHAYSHGVVDAGLKRTLFTGTTMNYSIWQALPDPDLILPFSSAVMDEKLRLLDHYRSQLEQNDFKAAVAGLNRFHGVTMKELSKAWCSEEPDKDPSEHLHPSVMLPFLKHYDDVENNQYAETFCLYHPMNEPRVLALGDIFLDVLPDPVEMERSEGSTSTRISLSPGGNAANFALALSRMGESAALYAKVGNDGIAELLEGRFRESGVRTFFLRDDPKVGSAGTMDLKPDETPEFSEPIREGTAITCSLSFIDGTRRFFSDFGSNLTFQVTDLPDLHQGFAHLHRAGYFWLPGLVGSPNEGLLRQAREIGMSTSIDIGTPPAGNGSDPWTDDIRDVVFRLLPFVDILFGNESEILGMWGGSAPGKVRYPEPDRNAGGFQDEQWSGETDVLSRAALELMEKGCGVVVIHRGSKGASLYHGTEVHHASARRVFPENPTGAGDIFNAGFISRYLRKEPLEACLAIAVAAGTYHVEHKEDPYPTLDRLIPLPDVRNEYHRREQNEVKSD